MRRTVRGVCSTPTSHRRGCLCRLLESTPPDRLGGVCQATLLRPRGGPRLSRYTHRVAISNSRLIAHDDQGVTFTWKDYRAKSAQRYKTMRLTNDEFIRRFLIHVLPTGGLFANHLRTNTVQQIRTLLLDDADHAESGLRGARCQRHTSHTYVCPVCGAPMIVIETIKRAHTPRAPPS